MTMKNVKWAIEHDWFLNMVLLNTGTWAVIVYDSETDGPVNFTDFNKLYNWAGY